MALALLKEKPPRLLSASELHSRTLLEDAVKACRAELPGKPPSRA